MKRKAIKIHKYELFAVPPRWLFLRIETKDGLVGWGEPTLEGRVKTVAAAVRELMDKYVIKADASRITDLWQVLYKGGFYRGGPVLMSALAGIDQALWDLKGKALGVPIYELLGGPCRDKVRVYRWIGGDEPAEVAEEARLQVAKGFTALKMNVAGRVGLLERPANVKKIAQRFFKVREVIGEEIDLILDFHGRISPALAFTLAPVLQEGKPLFYEEPIFPLSITHLSRLKVLTHIPLAFGERLYSRWDFHPFLEFGVIDIVQPDLSHAGGISECLRICTFAEAYGALVAFHCPLGPIALAASLQLAAVVPNFLIQETSLGIHYNEGVELTDYVINKEEFSPQGGYLALLSKPGLGVEIDEGAVRAAASKAVDWSNPIWRGEDGGLLEW
ncbi:MAG: galactonate dehydratase [Candidatus Bipolaricaulaceae bacterium]